MPDPRQPLVGVRVIDLGHVYQGPYATLLMALAGAEVIKVEPLAGERIRQPRGGDPSLAFAMMNANKKGVTLDLKQPRGRELLIELAKCGDVLVENFAPGVAERLGIGAEVLRLNSLRSLTALAQGHKPGAESSTQKLYYSEFQARLARFGNDLTGAYGQLARSERRAADRGRWSARELTSRGPLIFAGTSEIQRNIISERVLGLPRR